MKIYKTILTAMVLTGLIFSQPFDVKPENSERFKMMTIWKLTEHLKLTEDQAESFFPKFNSHQEKMDEINKSARAAVSTLREKVERGDAISDKELEAELNKLSAFERKRIDKQEKFIKSLEGVLNNAQRAKLMGFRHHLRDDIKGRIREHRKDMMKHNPGMMRYNKENMPQGHFK